MEVVDLASYGGIVIIAWAITEFVSRYVKWFVKKRKPLLALGATFVLGILSKIFGIGFQNINWYVLIISLFMAGAGVQVAHDKIMKPIGLNFKEIKSKTVKERICIFLLVGLLLNFGAVLSFADVQENPQEEVLLNRILELDKRLKDALANQQSEAVYIYKTQLKKAQNDYEKYLLKQEAIDDFEGLGFSVGVGMTFFMGDHELIEDAEIVNDIVRVKREGNVISRMMLESHYFFVLDDENNGKWGVGPFVGILTNQNELLDAFALGGMIGLRRLGETSSRSLNFGFGWVWDRNAKTLGDGIYANQPLPEGETEIRYKYKTLGGFLVICSFSF